MFIYCSFFKIFAKLQTDLLLIVLFIHNIMKMVIKYKIIFISTISKFVMARSYKVPSWFD